MAWRLLSRKYSPMAAAAKGAMYCIVAGSLAVANPTNERIFIRADRHVRYRQFMDVINQLQLDGYYKIGLIAENLGGG